MKKIFALITVIVMVTVIAGSMPARAASNTQESIVYRVPAGQVLTREDGREVSLYTKAEMHDGDKVYDLKAPTGTNLVTVRQNLGIVPGANFEVVIVSEKGVVVSITTPNGRWPN